MAPNPIDFDKVFTEFDRLPESGNVAVIIAVSCVFGLYLLLLVWARKADMQDALKVDIVFLRMYSGTSGGQKKCGRIYGVLQI